MFQNSVSVPSSWVSGYVLENNPKDYTRHSEHGESLISRIKILITVFIYCNGGKTKNSAITGSKHSPNLGSQFFQKRKYDFLLSFQNTCATYKSTPYLNSPIPLNTDLGALHRSELFTCC
jgi:hypothetical protein